MARNAWRLSISPGSGKWFLCPGAFLLATGSDHHGCFPEVRGVFACILMHFLHDVHFVALLLGMSKQDTLAAVHGYKRATACMLWKDAGANLYDDSCKDVFFSRARWMFHEAAGSKNVLNLPGSDSWMHPGQLHCIRPQFSRS